MFKKLFNDDVLSLLSEVPLEVSLLPGLSLYYISPALFFNSGDKIHVSLRLFA